MDSSFDGSIGPLSVTTSDGWECFMDLTSLAQMNISFGDSLNDKLSTARLETGPLQGVA